jgi:hypothetical protein
VSVSNHHQVMTGFSLCVLIQRLRQRVKSELGASRCSATNPALHRLSHLRANGAEVEEEQLQQLGVII